MTIALMTFVLFSMIIYAMLPREVINAAHWIAVLGMLSFGALVSFTIFVNQIHLSS